ncbi:MAG: hypothetical protein M3N16_04685, partial [Actinomycetota bacterium]|nr:hypothetical protein [Actinomycetota bacterium]
MRGAENRDHYAAVNGRASSSDAPALPWATLLLVALAAAAGFLVAFAATRAASGGAGAADRVTLLDAPGAQARVRNLERAGRIPELRLTSRSGGSRAAA